ncbi:hypothetical protein ACK8P5_13670 [Paenibacillus sp. EC2-1]|uniref:hypothetical protein n=1 Tax=Paenibacillus sp. EC2-1 TaxID=3388665 RepID=UPI003BEEFA5C
MFSKTIFKQTLKANFKLWLLFTMIMSVFCAVLMGKVDSSLEGFKYLSLNALFDTDAILNGGSYLIQFITLAFVGIILFAIGIQIFKEKDLPL